MVQVEKGHVAVVFLNDPERRNPLSPEMALSLLPVSYTHLTLPTKRIV